MTRRALGTKGLREYVKPPLPLRTCFAEAEKPSLRCGGEAVPRVDGADARKEVCAWMEQFVGMHRMG